MRQFVPKLMRARSRFEGVRTPRNEWNRRLRTKTALEQTSGTSTSKREEENQDITRVARTDKPTGTTVLRTDTISKAATKEGVVY